MRLKHLHSLNIVHRDLKPENVFLDNDGNAKTWDFGLALKMKRKSQVYGAGIQMPESSDILSLGVIITELLTCMHPFEGKTMDTMIANINNDKFRRLPDFVQSELKDMILCMISVDPNKHPTTQELLDSDMMQLLSKIDNEKEEKLKSISEKLKEQKRADETEAKIRVANLKIR